MFSSLNCILTLFRASRNCLSGSICKYPFLSRTPISSFPYKQLSSLVLTRLSSYTGSFIPSDPAASNDS